MYILTILTLLWVVFAIDPVQEQYTCLQHCQKMYELYKRTPCAVTVFYLCSDWCTQKP